MISSQLIDLAISYDPSINTIVATECLALQLRLLARFFIIKSPDNEYFAGYKFSLLLVNYTFKEASASRTSCLVTGLSVAISTTPVLPLRNVAK